MTEKHHNPTREEIAKAEIGRTTIRPALAWAMAALFTAGVFAVPVAQHLWEFHLYRTGERGRAMPQCYEIAPRFTRAALRYERSDRPFLGRVIAVNNRVLLPNIDEFEDELETQSLLQRAALAPVQRALARWTGQGTEKAYVGRDGWLVYRAGLDHVWGPGFLAPDYLEARSIRPNEWTPAPQPDPRKAIAQFRGQLAERGIELVIVPTPVKPTIRPDGFSGRYERDAEPVRNPSWDVFLAWAEAEGVTVFDPAAALTERKRSGEQAYLKTDTHWTPPAMRAVAEALAAFLTDRLELGRARSGWYHRGRKEVANHGDLAVMLQLDGSPAHVPERVTTEPVYTGRDGQQQVWRASRDAEVLVLGDSFSNIYSLEGMNWGFGAGFVEQLSAALARPADRIVRNDSGAFATRQMLSRELAGGFDRLAGKKVVVWQFATRELSVGDWKLLEMTLGEPAEGDFYTPEPGEPVTVTGTVRAVSPVPEPGSVAYPDHVAAVHLANVRSEDGSVEGGQAVVAMLGMLRNEWTAVARWRAGDEVTVRLRNWSDVKDRYESVRTTELADGDLVLAEKCWGEPAAVEPAHARRHLWRGWDVLAVSVGLLGVMTVLGSTYLSTRRARWRAGRAAHPAGAAPAEPRSAAPHATPQGKGPGKP